LERKGFEVAQGRRGPHTVLIYHNLMGEKTGIWTMLSHGNPGQEIRTGLFSIMARQCGLARAEFVDLINCAMPREEYDGLIAPNA
jgi:hypothetical protein